VQLVALAQAIPNNSFHANAFGVDTPDQVVPFQRSINVVLLSSSKIVSTPPTAKQFVAEVHVTSFNRFCSMPGLGLAMIDQFEPFHRSMSVFDEKLPSTWVPTAKQFVVLGHAMPLSTLAPPAGFGLGTIDHVEPFQRSTSELFAA
jgi:hypothetical protein